MPRLVKKCNFTFCGLPWKIFAQQAKIDAEHLRQKPFGHGAQQTQTGCPGIRLQNTAVSITRLSSFSMPLLIGVGGCGKDDSYDVLWEAVNVSADQAGAIRVPHHYVRCG